VRKRPELWENDKLHQDTITTSVKQQFLTKRQHSVIRRFQLHVILNGTRFGSVEAVKTESTKALREKHFQYCFGPMENTDSRMLTTVKKTFLELVSCHIRWPHVVMDGEFISGCLLDAFKRLTDDIRT